MIEKKEMRHGTKVCNALYRIENTPDGIPYLECQGCGAKVEDWIKWKNSYIDYWKDETKWASKKDHIICLLGYFSKLYKESYETDFIFSLNDKGLFRGPEAYLVRKMYTLLGNDVFLSRDYLDWVFAAKVSKRKKKITSIGFLATPAIIQEFKLSVVKKNKISRSTLLPPKMIEWIRRFAPNILDNFSLRDYGELQLLLEYYKNGYDTAQILPTFIEKLQATNHIDCDYNIKNWSN